MQAHGLGLLEDYQNPRRKKNLQPASTWHSTSTEALVCIYEQTNLSGN